MDVPTPGMLADIVVWPLDGRTFRLHSQSIDCTTVSTGMGAAPVTMAFTDRGTGSVNWVRAERGTCATFAGTTSSWPHAPGQMGAPNDADAGDFDDALAGLADDAVRSRLRMPRTWVAGTPARHVCQRMPSRAGVAAPTVTLAGATDGMRGEPPFTGG